MDVGLAILAHDSLSGALGVLRPEHLDISDGVCIELSTSKRPLLIFKSHRVEVGLATRNCGVFISLDLGISLSFDSFLMLLRST